MGKLEDMSHRIFHLPIYQITHLPISMTDLQGVSQCLPVSLAGFLLFDVGRRDLVIFRVNSIQPGSEVKD